MPRQVQLAVGLLCLHFATSIAIGVPKFAGAVNIAPPIIPQAAAAIIVWSAFAFFALLIALLIYFIGRGSPAARLILLVFVAVEVLAFAVRLVQHSSGLLQLPAALGMVALRVTALVLVYTKPSNAWFERRAA
jgi:hypothetical protein